MTSSTHERADTCTPGKDPLPRALPGTWLLREVVEVDAAGNVTAEPYGTRPSGRLIYAPDGTMAVVIREHGSSPAVAYAGQAVQVADDLLRHVVQVGLPPYTEDQVRHMRPDATSLVLATDTGDSPRIELHWERG